MRSDVNIDVDDANALKKLKEQLEPRLYNQIQDTIRDFYQDIHHIDERLSLLTNDTTQSAQNYLNVQKLQQQLNDVLVKLNRKTDACRNLLGDSARAKSNFNAYRAEVQTQVDSISIDCKEITTIKNALALIPNQELLTKQLEEVMQELEKVKRYVATLTAPAAYSQQGAVVSVYNDLRTRFISRYKRSAGVADKLRSTMTSTLSSAKQDKIKSNKITLDKEVNDCKTKVKALFDHVKTIDAMISSQKSPSLFQQAAPQSPGSKPSTTTGKNAKK